MACALSVPPRAPPEGALIPVRGRGADENDLLGLADAFDPRAAARRRDAGGPLSPVPPGGTGTSWGASAIRTRRRFSATYERLARRPGGAASPWERTVLGGFTQGTAMSYAVGLGTGARRRRGSWR